jgi:hypothetical protein
LQTTRRRGPSFSRFSCLTDITEVRSKKYEARSKEVA